MSAAAQWRIAVRSMVLLKTGGAHHDFLDHSGIADRRTRRDPRRAGTAPQPGHAAYFRAVQAHPARHVRHRARRARGRHHLVGCRPVLGPARLGQADETAQAHAHRRRTVVPRRGSAPPVRTGGRLGIDASVARHSRAGLAVCARQGFSRHDHPQGVRRQGLLRLHALAGGDAAVHPFVGAGRAGDGTQLAGTCRTAAPLWHRRPEKLLPATPGRRQGNPVLRAHQPLRGVRCCRHSRHRRGLHGHPRRPRDAGPAHHLEQALHHAGPHRHPAWPGVPRGRSRPPAASRDRHRHHLRADTHHPRGRGDRPPPLAAGRRVPERPNQRQGRVHSDGLDHRRAAADRQGLAHADGVPGGRSRDFPAIDQRGHRQAGRARHQRLLRDPAPVQNADRQVRGCAGSAGPHGRQPVHDGRHPQAVRAGRGPW